jgi:hypothetical protein
VSPADALRAWVDKLQVLVPKRTLDRAVRKLDKAEAVALLRGAYDCTVAEAEIMYAATMVDK